MGVDFFRRVTQLQKIYGFSGARVANNLQTNAVCIEDDLVEHLHRYNFLVGVSLDGPPEIHDRYRRFQNGAGSHAQVMRGLKTLRCAHVDTNILTLVTAANVGQGRNVFLYLLDQGFSYHQYIPCVEFDAGGQLLPYALKPEEWGEFLCTVFDQWMQCSNQEVSVR